MTLYLTAVSTLPLSRPGIDFRARGAAFSDGTVVAIAASRAPRAEPTIITLSIKPPEQGVLFQALPDSEDELRWLESRVEELDQIVHQICFERIGEMRKLVGVTP